MADTECPYCGADIEINHDDGIGYEEDRAHEQYCGSCDNNFIYYTSIHFSYNTKKADCLNGSDHKYSPTTTIPKYLTKMRCDDCAHEREPTENERIELGIAEFKL